ncbi:MAG: hypothetical protein ABSH34_28335 [Verrucomicrobiota bacterium]
MIAWEVYEAAPLALTDWRANGPAHTSLGQRPRLARQRTPSANGAIHRAG